MPTPKPDTPTLERRFHQGPLTVRADEGAAPEITGYAAVFNSIIDLGWYSEVIRPGAFARAIREHHDVRALVNHDASLLLARTKSHTLELAEDEIGLFVRILPPDTQLARDTTELVRRADLDGMSFAFMTRRDNWRFEAGQELREILDVDLVDVSLVTFPAYEATAGLLALRAKPPLARRTVASRRRHLTLLSKQ
jgi:HK97 family phage prohead protease